MHDNQIINPVIPPGPLVEFCLVVFNGFCGVVPLYLESFYFVFNFLATENVLLFLSC